MAVAVGSIVPILSHFSIGGTAYFLHILVSPLSPLHEQAIEWPTDRLATGATGFERARMREKLTTTSWALYSNQLEL